jgi:phenylalanyl-tRNA synthetase beta chain
LVNPLNADRPYLRNTLLPALLESVAANLRHERRVGLFELARVYLPAGRNELPTEVQTLGIVLAGQRDEFDRFASSDSVDFFDLKGIVDEALLQVNVTGVSYETAESPGFHPGRTARILHGDTVVGIVGELHPETAASFGINGIRVVACEIDAEALLELSQRQRKTISAPRFLPVEQDLAVVVREETSAAEVEAALRNGAGPLLTDIVLFDVFRGSQIGDENKSLAYRLTFTSPGRALTDNDLVKVRGKIERTIKQVGGKLRV